MGKYSNIEWQLPEPKLETWEQVNIAVLMDIRHELQTLNNLLACPKFLAIPRTLELIRQNTVRKKKQTTHHARKRV